MIERPRAKGIEESIPKESREMGVAEQDLERCPRKGGGQGMTQKKCLNNDTEKRQVNNAKGRDVWVRTVKLLCYG